MNPTDDGRLGIKGVAPEADARLARALEEYRELLEAGTAPDRESFLARHPEVAEELAECLSGLEFVHAVAPALSGAAAEGTAAGVAGVGPAETLGDFRIVREVGRGGMGVVYEAEQLSLGRRVALKVLPFASTLDPRQLQRFHNEARAAAGLHHTNIVPVYAVGSERGVHYYAMQFIEGRTLAEFISRQRGEGLLHVPTMGEAEAAASATTVPPAAQATSAAPRDAAYFRRVAEWGIQAAEALDCAHALGVVHRDVKPANLLVDAAGRLWVTDFGLAQIQNDARLTMSGDLVGTLRYMSPEQALAKRVVIDHRTDVYSLGATLYELLALQPTFAGTDRQELLRQIAFEEPKALRRGNKAIPADLETIVLKALEKNPAERYATAKELADDLRRWVEDRPIRARRPSPVQRLRKWGRRHRAAVWAAVVCLLVTLVALGGTGGRLLSDRAARHREAEDKVKWALEAAKPGLRDGNPSDPALTSARMLAQAQLAGGALGPESQERVRQLQRDVWMLESLARFRRNREAHAHSYPTLKMFGKPFQDYGIDVEALGPAEAAARIQESAIREHLVAGLDEWAHHIMMYAGDEKMRQPGGRLLALVRLADPDPWRNRLRDIVLSGDLGGLGPLAQSAPVEELPAATLGLLARLADGSPEPAPEPVLDALRSAQLRFPGDYQINYHLAQVLSKSPTVECRQEAIGFIRVAVALRPEDQGALLQLAGVLHRAGEMAEEGAVYRKAISLKPDDPWRYEKPGDALMNQGQHQKAAAAFSEAIKLQPEQDGFWVQRGCAYAEAGQWEKASADFVRATECKEPHFGAWYCRAMLCLRDGNLDGYRTICSDMLQRFDVPGASTCALTPNSGADSKQLVSLAEKAVAQSKDHFSVNLLGQALYRAGRFEDAIGRLTEATALTPDPRINDVVYTWFFLAMAHHRLRHADEARHWLDKGIRTMEEELKRPPESDVESVKRTGTIPPNWYRRLTLQLFRREAEELIQGPGTKPGK
jgi:serine/threonine protein kinase/tetratricopeptide (TPR) repeat protein